MELYLKDKTDENDQPLKVVHEVVSNRWEVALTLSEKGYQQVSFVNSVATTKVSVYFIPKLIHMLAPGLESHVGSWVERIGPLQSPFLAGCCIRQLNQALSVLSS